MPTFGSKNALFKYFGLAFEKKLLSYLKSAPSNLSHCKILQKKEKPKLGTKNALFRYFWAKTLKSCCCI